MSYPKEAEDLARAFKAALAPQIAMLERFIEWINNRLISLKRGRQ